MYTTTKNALTATVATSKKFAFTFDHVNKKIVGTDINFQKAGIPGSVEEKELDARMEARPNYTFMVIETEKKPAKQTYKGLNRPLMREYINIQAEAIRDDLIAQFDKMVEDKIAQPTIKSWFLEEFKGFTVSKAQREIQQYKLADTKNRIRKIKATPKATSSQTLELRKLG